ncbi:MAG: cupin domain-containing protein [Deltaproteobacteria bacterium]|nr:MAG: cupin domain-containing protein [Deltaproteobacteria bacterium]RUA00106.1 MAG: cupin domain-containing protein [Deltaproteobacteria bacterium]
MPFFEMTDIPAKEIAPGINIRVIPGQRMTMVQFSLDKGAPIPEHAHPHEQVGAVIKGRMEMKIGETTRIVRSGSAWQIPADVVHSGHCLEDGTVVLECFSPPREDLEKK